VTGFEVGSCRNRKTPNRDFFAVIGYSDPCFSGVEGGRGTVGEVKTVRSGYVALPEMVGGEGSWPAK
jgi:hypothetical protein